MEKSMLDFNTKTASLLVLRGKDLSPKQEGTCVVLRDDTNSDLYLLEQSITKAEQVEKIWEQMKSGIMADLHQKVEHDIFGKFLHWVESDTDLDLEEIQAVIDDEMHTTTTTTTNRKGENTMKKIIDLANCDALITDIANALFEHDAECTRYDESIWVYVNEDDNTGKVIVSSRYDNHISDNYIFVTDMNGTSEDALDQYMAASDSPIADLAYLFGMEYEDLRKKASEEENVDLEDVDYHVVAEYIRNTPELLAKVEEEFRDWLQDVSEYRFTAEKLIAEQEKEADRVNENESIEEQYWGGVR